MTTYNQLENAITSLETSALKVKRERDALLQTCVLAYKELDNVYDVDEPEPGHRKEYPFSGAGELMSKLRLVIELCGGKL